MSRRTLHPVIHAPNRLKICALLTPLDEAEFLMLREAIDVSDSVLSKHIKRLEDAGYVRMRKGVVNGRQRSWVGLTEEGRQAFAEHVTALQEIAALAQGGAGESMPTDGRPEAGGTGLA